MSPTIGKTPDFCLRLDLQLENFQVYFNESTMNVFGDISVDDFRDMYPRYPDIEV